MPRLGYWGPHDVCLNTWLVQLHRAVHELDASGGATFVFDEGEQGQPSFEFRRDSAALYLSVKGSLISDGLGDPAWSDVPCDYDDFRFQVLRFSGRLSSTLTRELGTEKAHAWLQETLRIANV